MSNDIPKDMNNYVNLPKNGNRKQEAFEVKENKEPMTQSVPCDIDMEKSMDYLLGKMQVNSMQSASKRNNTQEACEEFLRNPDDIQYRVDLCDELVKKGYSLEDAILKTDMFFKALGSDIYE